jgi:NhaA family Na+:H+ antiporter
LKERPARPASVFREFLEGEASAGIMLMAAALLALIVANSPFSDAYFAVLKSYVGPLNVEHWINDGLMAAFFLLVGLEIKREVLDGQLSTWPRRVLPGIAALGGMVVPAVIYVAINARNPQALPGWAIPTATDIAFALGVLSLLGSRVPASLKVFLTALAIIDDLGAVIIIALFYSGGLSLPYLAGAALVLVLLVALNRLKVLALAPYVVLGLVLWVLVLKSGVHATLAGVALALTVPLRTSPGLARDLEASPLHRLEHALHKVVPFIVIPVFGFANAGVSFTGMSMASLTEPLTLGVVCGLVAGKLVGVLGTSALAIRLGFADLPARAGWSHMTGVAFLCGIGFTMSLFIGLLAFAYDPEMQKAVKLGILAGSLAAALLGTAVLLAAPRPAGADDADDD